MSQVEMCLAWCRARLSWSNSRQSWAERVSGLWLVLTAAGLWTRGDRLPLIVQVILWGLLFLAAAILLRRGWLKLFGPVLFYDMLCLARRGRYILLRIAYAGLLVFFLFSTWLSVLSTSNLADKQRAALMAESYFGQFMLIQLLAVSALTPAYVAGSIAEEKDRKTLEFMLATDLRNREIVLSKVGSRLANLTLFVMTGLPILSILQFLGGVDPHLMLAGFLATFMTMVGLAGFSILCSVQFKKPRDAIAVSYLGALTYGAVGLVAFILEKSFPGFFALTLWPGDEVAQKLGDLSPKWIESPPTLADVTDFFNSGNLLVALVKVMQAIATAGLGPMLGGIVRSYTFFHAVVGLTCTVWAVVRLRAIALQQSYGEPRKTLFRHRGRPEVGALPMLWKEVHVEGNVRFNWAARIFAGLLFLLTVGGPLWVIGYALWEGNFFNDPSSFIQVNNMLLRTSSTVVCCLLLLGVAVRASTAISSERDKDTFDALLTSPLDSDSILWAKFLGCLVSMRRAFLWPCMIWLIGLLTGTLNVFALPLLLLALAIYASTITMLGLWFSMVCRTSMRATIWSVMSTVGIGGLHWLPWACCAPLLFMSAGGHNVEKLFEYVWKFQAGLTPPVVLAVLPLGGFEFRHDHEFAEFLVFCFLGLAIYVLANLFFWLAILSPRFRMLTHREDFLYPRAEASYRMMQRGNDNGPV